MFYKLNLWRRTHRIEIFGYGVFITLICMIVLCGFIKIGANQEDRSLMDTKAIYVKDFTTSISGVKGAIREVYVNADRTKCGILVKLESSSQVSGNATDYQVFVKGYDPIKARYDRGTFADPSGGYCVFGSTGYALVYLVENRGFGDQALECVVRSNNILHRAGTTSAEAAELKRKDGSYADFDQYRIIVNPNAAEATVVSFLDELDAVMLYQQAIMNGEERDIQETLRKDLEDMNTALAAVNSYRDALTQRGVRVPALPEEIAGDKFQYFEHPDTHEQILVYTPGKILPGGVNFDWFGWDIQKAGGFLHGVIGNRSPGQFFGDLANAQTTPSEAMQALSGSGGTWYMTDGSAIEVNTRSNLADVAAVSQAIENYRTSVRKYHDLKRKYQCEDMVKYLYLEYNMQGTEDIVSGNFAEGTITAW